jgi:tetratricopeptide (TPR) repeat protein
VTAETEHGEMSLPAAAALSELALVQRVAGQRTDAIATLSRAVNMRSRSSANDAVAQAKDLTALGLIYLADEDTTMGKPALLQALDEWARAMREGPEVLPALESLAGLYREEADYAAAEPLYKRALRIREMAYGSESSELLAAIDSLAYVYFGLKQYAPAEPLYTRLIRLWEKSAGPEHPMVALSLDKYAEFLCAQNRYAEATPLVERSLAIRAQMHISSINYRARLALMQAKKDEGALLLKSALGVGDAARLPDAVLFESLRVYAALLRDENRLREAQQYESRVKSVIMSGPARPLPPARPAPARPR